jgi:mono/diheme cytochrome c family protein
MRPPVAGTVALGELDDDPHFHLGYRPEDGEEANGAGEAGAGEKDEPDYFTTIPERLEEKIPALMARGRERFNIYCAVCHGEVGDGAGMTSLRAIERRDPEWAPPTSIHKATIRNQPVGKLFNTITNGLGKMPGYAAQIPVEDRWSIVLYVRALQRSQNAPVEDVPEEVRPQLR